MPGRGTLRRAGAASVLCAVCLMLALAAAAAACPAGRAGRALRVPRLGRTAAAGERDRGHRAARPDARVHPLARQVQPRVGRPAAAARRLRPGGDRKHPRGGRRSGRLLRRLERQEARQRVQDARARSPAPTRRSSSAYSLHAIDVDIEHSEFTKPAARQRVIEALAFVQAARPGPRDLDHVRHRRNRARTGRRSLIADAAAIGFQPSAWTIMPFDFGAPLTDMGHASIRALEGLRARPGRRLRHLARASPTNTPASRR